MSDDDLPAALETEPEPQPVRVHEQAPRTPQEEARDAATVASGDAPALKPAARRTPAPKAPARKAPARKAAVTTAPAGEAVTPAPAKKAATKAPAKAPAKKAPAKAATKAPAKAPAKKAPAKAPAPKTVAAPVVEVIAPAPAPAPVDFAELLGLEPAPARRLSGATRFVLTLVALLLAGAVGMGAAALVEAGQETWRSAVTVRLTPGPAPSGNAAATVTAGQSRYADKLPTLTMLIATAAGVPQDDVRRDLTVRRVGSDQLEIMADTASAAEARALAAQAAKTVVNGVPGDQAATVTNPGDRLGALLSDYPSTPERTRPSDLLALVVGGVAATAVLLLAASLALLARGRED